MGFITRMVNFLVHTGNMARSFRLVFVLAMLLADISGAAQIGTPTLVPIQTPRAVTQAFILIEVDEPVASVILSPVAMVHWA